jgi:hypothetical protein
MGLIDFGADLPKRYTIPIFLDQMRKSRLCIRRNGFSEMVPGAGIEPARLAAGDFESPASTNFTTRANSM